jgi:3-oxoacyl-[acyl-carrier protein] reductase
VDYGLSQKVALVAAGSKGIGLATAKLLKAEGCRVSICARNPESLSLAAKEIGNNTHTSVCDVTQPDQIEAWIASAKHTLGAPDILVTNTGGPPAGYLNSVSDEQWYAGFESTLLNILRMVRHVSPDMKAKGFGRIVHITSLVAKEPSDLLPISSTLRAGILALTRLQSNELSPFGVTVNGILPGHTLTERQVHLAEIRAERERITLEQALQLQAESVPMKRLGTPEEIAAAIVFFCSVGAGYVSGTSLLVDGGLTKGFG